MQTDDQTAQIDIADLSSLVTGMSRLLSGLEAILPLKEANLGLAEWVALSVLVGNDGVSSKQLARALGLTGQRARQITGSLSKAELITIAQSKTDSRIDSLTVTAAGKVRYESVNAQLEPLLATVLKDRERALAGTNKAVKTLMRVVRAGKPDKAVRVKASDAEAGIANGGASIASSSKKLRFGVQTDDQTAKSDIADFSSLVTGMSRLLTGLAAIPPLKEANLGLAEWAALSVLVGNDGVSNKRLDRVLGLTAQRARQITGSLSAAGLIAIAQSQADNRINSLTVTAAGKARYENVNTQLEPLLATALKDRERALASANKAVKTLMRVVLAGKPDKSAGAETADAPAA